MNRTAALMAVRFGLATGATVNRFSVFARKNYFYPDLPPGYQISQFTQPIVGRGVIEIELDDGTTRNIGITRLHLEQDAGKSLHDQDPTLTYVDLNRAGVALMEIVSEPDLRTAEEAAAYLTKMRSVLRHLGTCDGNMQEGSMRADVNVSVRRPNEALGTRCEIKNLNSIRFVRQAIEVEAQRQIEVIEGGGTIDQETRLFDSERVETRPMRSKEESHDYRYFPDPDLLPLELDPEWVEEIRVNLPELPDAKKARYMVELGLTAYDASILVAERETAAFFETVAEGRDAKTAANWITSDLFGALNKLNLGVGDSLVTADRLGELIDLIVDDTISGRIAKDVFEVMFETGEAALDIVEKLGLRQVTDSSAIESVIDGIIVANPSQVEQFQSGNQKIIGWFVGQVMKETQGKANPKAVNEILRSKLEG